MSERVYEVLFIADPGLGEAEVDTLTNTVQGFVEKEGGKVEKVEKWGKKRLAYVVGKHREGSYVLLTVHGGGPLVKEVERQLGVTSVVISHDIASAFKVADKIAFLHQGHIVEQGPPAQLRNSEHPAVRVFLQTWFGKN